MIINVYIIDIIIIWQLVISDHKLNIGLNIDQLSV